MSNRRRVGFPSPCIFPELPQKDKFAQALHLMTRRGSGVSLAYQGAGTAPSARAAAGPNGLEANERRPQTAASRYPLAPSNGPVPTTLVDAHSVPVPDTCSAANQALTHSITSSV